MSLSVEKQHFFKYKFSLDFANVQRFSEQTKESTLIPQHYSLTLFISA